MKQAIHIKNAKTNNLKQMSLDIPLNQLVVITGPSGSGKSSLAFDTIFKEGQKRYLEALAGGTSVGLVDLSPTDVEEMTGVPPAIAIDQNTIRSNPRSTVGTISEIYDLLRVLYSKVGKYRDQNNNLIQTYTAQEIFDQLYRLPEKTKIAFCIKSDTSKKSLQQFLKLGFFNAYQNNKIIELDELIKSSSKNKFCHIIIDRIILTSKKKKRILDAIENSLYHGKGKLEVFYDQLFHTFTTKLLDEQGNELPELTPKFFSFNSPLGACPTCKGLGYHYTATPEELLDCSQKTLLKSIKPISHFKTLKLITQQIIKEFKFTSEVKQQGCPEELLQAIFWGLEKEITITIERSKIKLKFPGIIPWMFNELQTTSSEKIKKELASFLRQETCPQCNGTRLNTNARSVYIDQISLDQLIIQDLEHAKQTINNLKLEASTDRKLAKPLIDNISERLSYLISIGLGYLQLNRSAQTLSGGELQRLKLAAQLGTQLTRVLYILDEPSIGLHPNDTHKLLKTLDKLKAKSNSIIVVEHDMQIIHHADHIIDIGPGAGIHGGKIVYQGTTSSFTIPSQITPTPFIPQKATYLTMKGINQHNLNNINLKLPLSGITCITGVSGSGKSTLIHHVLVPALKFYLNPTEIQYNLDNFVTLDGHQELRSIIEIDQKPIGRSPKSTPITFLGIFDDIRKFFAKLPMSQVKGYSPSHFSYNMKEGRCPTCEGRGQKVIEIPLLPNTFVMCDTCLGGRFNSEVTTVTYRGLSIADILQLTVEQACELFKYHKKIATKLSVLNETGLGYLTLGQSALTLSGGEAQRLKLAKHLSKQTKGKTLYVLDEPSTGLHRGDIATLIKIINRLTLQGHPIVIIEHNPDIIKIANYIIDLGPEGGQRGGKIIAQGSVDDIINCKTSLTGKWLKEDINEY